MSILKSMNGPIDVIMTESTSEVIGETVKEKTKWEKKKGNAK